MNLVNKLLNGLVTFGFVFLFYKGASNFWVALPFLLIYTIIIIPTLITSDSKYFSKLINSVFCITARVFAGISKKIEIERNAVKFGLFFGGIFYLIIIFTMSGSIKSIKNCLNENGASKMSYCYATYERRELTVNADQ